MNRDPALQHPLVHRLIEARRVTDALFAVVKPEFLYERPIRERHRIVFYIGHLEAFDRNLFDRRLFDLPALSSELDQLFAFGIDPVDDGFPTDVPSDWPSLEVVSEYAAQARAQIDQKLTSLEITNEGMRTASAEQLLHVAIEHRLMHAETLAYMLHQLPLDRKVPHRESLKLSNSPVIHRSIEISAGEVTLGLSRDSGVFGWDNEFEAHTVQVPAFSIDQYKVTNRQFLEFMNEGGYETASLWIDGADDDDWNWRSERKISHPAFWKRQGDRWMYRTMFEDIPLPLDWPVYVSQAEAKAYGKWAGKSLPTEAEWQRAAYGDRKARSPVEQVAKPEQGNYDFHRWSPVLANASQQAQSPFGVEGMLGNGWEWTSTPFAAFPGFEPFPFYRGYSADFFDGKHFVMKGGSARTAACMLRPTFRNWFQAHYQYIYTGFRCVNR